MRNRIPKDIQSYVRNRRLKCIVPCVLLLTALVILAVWNPPILAELAPLNRTLSFAVATIVVLWVTGVPFRVIDTTWSGKIVDIKEKTKTESNFPAVPQKHTLYTARTTYFIIENSRGKRRRYVAEKRNAKYYPNSDEKFKIGDEVLHISGTDYTIVLNDPKRRSCIVCGLNAGEN